MLACGEASAPALAVLRRHSAARAITVSETDLLDPPRVLADYDGPLTTPSGAAGLAGVIATIADAGRAKELRLDRSSRILVLVTERPPEG
jgi:diaminopropionate ammonia-lyase